jgi:hypothetical protein
MKFSMSEAWREATAMMSANRELLLIIAALFFLLPNLLAAVIMPDMQQAMMADPENAEAVMSELLAETGPLLLVGGLVLVLVQIVGNLAMLALLRDANRPTVAEALRAGLAGLVPAIGFYLLLALGFVGMAFVIGLLAAVSPGLGVVVALLCVVGVIYALIKLSLVLAVIAIEKISNPIAAMRRSWQLTKGNSLRLFLFFLLLFIVYLVVAIVVGMIVGALALALGEDAALVVNGVISGVLSAAVTVVIVAVVAAIHRQLSGPMGASVSQTFE